MNTIKRNQFAYAPFVRSNADSSQGDCMFEAFECVSGFVLALACSPDKFGNLSDSPQASTGQLVSQVFTDRLRYYLLNEKADQPDKHLEHALLYVDSFLKARAGKESCEIPRLNYACVVYHNESIHVATSGMASVSFFDGRDLQNLCQGSEPRRGARPEFAGSFEPLDQDVVLLSAGNTQELAGIRDIRRILRDSMPLHTKAARLFSGDKDQGLASCLISFYGLSRKNRVTAAGISDTLNESSFKKKRNAFRKKEKPEKADSAPGSWIRYALYVLAVLILAYMVHDLFLFNPRPARSLITEPESATTDSLIDKEIKTSELWPADIAYTVASGDSWSAIYARFGVCSWFIRQHQPNAGKFDTSGNPVAGSRLLIPVMYSAREDLNPVYHQYFRLEKLGNACQEANQDYLDKFHREHPRR